jgi:hypothetical protein
MQTVIRIFEAARRLGQRFGPYLLLELILPGGTLFALLLFIYQNRKRFAMVVPRPAMTVTRALVHQGG